MSSKQISGLGAIGSLFFECSFVSMLNLPSIHNHDTSSLLSHHSPGESNRQMLFEARPFSAESQWTPRDLWVMPFLINTIKCYAMTRCSITLPRIQS
jgi:hypothetical protein